MRRLAIAMVAALLVTVALGTAYAEQKRVQLHVVGLLCGKDVFAIEAILKGVRGVSDYEMDIETQKTTLTIDSELVDMDALKALFLKDDYPVSEVTYLTE